MKNKVKISLLNFETLATEAIKFNQKYLKIYEKYYKISFEFLRDSVDIQKLKSKIAIDLEQKDWSELVVAASYARGEI